MTSVLPTVLVRHLRARLRASQNPGSCAQGIVYTRALATGWKPPLRVRRLSDGGAQELRDKFHIIVEGDNLLPPVTDFADLKFPPAVLRHLASKNIRRPTPIQMQVRHSETA